MKRKTVADAIIDSRYYFREADKLVKQAGIEAEEGGCGVTGFVCSIPVSGRHIFEPSVQMHNRGNGKGGGLAAVGLIPAQMGVDQETLDNDFLLNIAVIDETVLLDMEARFIRPYFRVSHEAFIPTIDDYRDVEPRGEAPCSETLFCAGKAGGFSAFSERARP